MSSSDDKNLTPKENFTGVTIEGDSVVIPPNAEDIILVVEADSSVSGTVNVELEHSADNVNFVAAQNQPILTSPISFALNSSSFSVNEGASVTISLITVNVPNGTIVPYTISGVSSADIGGASLTGSFNVGTTNSVTLNITNDNATEGVETLNFALDNGKDSLAITINDTSTGTVSYSLARSTAAASEDGGQIDFTLTTTGVLDGTSVPYTITGIQSADITQSLTGNFVVTGGTATVSINHVFDLLTAENEIYTLALDNSQASITGTISDSNVTLASSAASINEGQSVTITATSTNISAGTNIPYTVTGVTSADISGASLFGAFVEGTTNSVTFNIANDNLTEGTETLVLSLNNSTPTISTSVTINDTSTATPTYSLSPTPAASVDEGNTLTIDLTTTNVSNGTTVPYTITGVSSADISGASLTGNFTVNNNAAQVVLTIAADATTEGAETLSFALDNGADSFSVTVNDTSTTPAPTYSLSSTPGVSVDEGNTLTVDLTTTNVSDGTLVPYTISGVSSADISGASLTGNFTVNSNAAQLVFTIAADATTEGAETLNFALDNGADSFSITVNDTSTTPAPTYTLSRSAASVNEGSSVDITLTTTNVSDGTNVPYTITGISSADLSSGSLTGNFTISSNTATLTFGLAADSTTEGAETLSLALDNGADTITVTVNDTSTGAPFQNRYYATGSTSAIEWYISSSTKSLYPSLGTSANAMPSVSDDFSISFWVQFSSMTATGTYTPFFQMASGSAAQIKFYRSNGITYYSFTRDSNGGNCTISHSISAFSTGWNHVVVTKAAGTMTPGNLTVYIDGSAVTTSTITNTFGTGTTGWDNDNVDKIYAGGSSLLSAVSGNQIGRSTITVDWDELVGWNKELSSTEVTALWNNGTQPDIASLSFYSSVDSWFRMGDGPNDSVANSQGYDIKDATRYIETYPGSLVSIASLGSSEEPYV